MFVRLVVAAALLSPLASAQVVNQPAPKATAQKTAQATLTVGHPAPALAVEKWVKGSAVPAFERGKVYVVEFWATWCGPCIAGMPHLSELQHTYAKKGVTIIGVSSIDTRGNSLEAVEAMVADKGDVMGYTVAWDTERKTNEAYMKAAGQGGIPCCFLVDKVGAIAYIGHPLYLDVPLKHVIAGTWDIEKGNAMVSDYRAALNAVHQAAGADPKTALTKLGELETKFPDFAGMNDSLHFNLALRTGNTEAVSTIGTKLVDAAIANKDAAGLNQIAWSIVDPEAEVEKRDVALALRAAEKAAEFTEWKDAAILDTVARVYAWKGDFAKAIELQTKALEHANEQLKADIVRALEEYQGKLKK